MASSNPAPKNVALDLYFFIAKTDGTIIANPGGLASRLCQDGTGKAGAAPTCVDTTGGTCKLTIAQADMNYDCITVKATSTDSGAIPFVATIYTSGQTLDDIDTEVDAIQTAVTTTIPAQISGIGSGTGAALNYGANTDSGTTDPLNGVTKVGTATGDYTSTYFDNNVYEVITHATNNIDWVYRYSVGSGRVASKVTFAGYLAASSPQTSKSVSVYAYNFDGSSWDSIGSITGQAGTTDIVKDFTLLSRNTGTGANAGLVYIRFTATSQAGAVLNVDQLTTQAQNLGQTVGYADGSIWIGGANSNTTPYVDGTADNPVTYAAAKTISASIGLTRFRVRNGTTVTLDASAANKSFIGSNWTLALGGQAIDGAYFEGATVSGTGTCTTSAEFIDCHIAAGTTVGPCSFVHTGFAGTSGSPVVAGSAGQFLFVDCFSEVAGLGTPYFTLSGASGINFRRWSGGSNITLNNSSATLTIEVITGGGQTIATAGANVEIRGITRSVSLTGIATGATCQIDAITGPITLAGADGTVNIYGICSAVTDNRTGSPTLSTFADVHSDVGTLSTTVGSAGAGLTAVPWNASWDAEVQSEVTDALNAYDPPTNAEMEARTLVSAGYATPTNITAASGVALTAAYDAAKTAATQTSVDTVDTVVDAIKVQTDKLKFTVTNEVDANVQSVNDTALTGDGSVATPWGPA